MEDQAQKTILLICTAGITTGLLVKNMQRAADEKGLAVHIYSAPAIIAEQILRLTNSRCFVDRSAVEVRSQSIKRLSHGQSGAI